MQEEKELQVVSIALKKAKECIQDNNNGLAFANFLVVFKLAPQLQLSMESEFLECMNQWCDTLRKAHRYEDLLQCLHEACSVLPNNPKVLNNMGTELFQLGFLDEAASYFRMSLRADSTFLLARFNLQNLCSHVVERWHFRMLNDTKRNTAFKTAICTAVNAGCIDVLDIGSGTGLLSMFAANAGAKAVYGCEMSKAMYDISCECITFNHFTEEVNLLHKKSTELTVPEDIPKRVSLLITETFDAGLLGEHIISTLAHAWHHLLLNTPSKKCRVIPEAATVYVSAVESDWLRKKHRVIYPGVRYLEYGKCQFMSDTGLPVDDLNTEPYTSYRLCDIPGGFRYLSDKKMIEKFLFSDPEAVSGYHSGFNHSHVLTLTSQGHLDAIVLWFELHLDESVSLSTHPSSESCWEQAVYPVLPTHFKDLSSSLTVAQDDQVVLDVQCRNDALHIKPIQLLRHTSVAQPESVMQSENHGSKDASTGTVPTDLDFILSSEEISSLNNLTWNQMHCQALEEAREELRDLNTFSVLFLLHSISILPLQALKLGASAVCIISKNPMMQDVLAAIAAENQLSLDRLEYVSCVEEVQGRWDVLVADVLECCGSLQSQILEEIALCRMTCMSPENLVIPQSINVYGVLVESPSLLEDSCVVSKANTLELEIGRFINDFQMTQHVDIHLSTLKHQKLSVPFKMFTFDFTEPLDENSSLEMTFLHQATSLAVTASEMGTITAILYWFDLTLSSSIHYSTLDIGSHIHQAASILKEPATVNAGTEITVKALCKNSCIDLMLI